MTDTLRAMRVVEAIGRAHSLDGACDSLTQTALFRQPFDAVAIVATDDSSQLDVLARCDRHGVFNDAAAGSLWASREFASALSLAHASTLRAPAGDAPAAELWVLPLRSGPRFIGALLGWSKASLSREYLSDSAQTVVSAAIKSALRAHRPPRAAAVTIPRRQAG